MNSKNSKKKSSSNSKSSEQTEKSLKRIHKKIIDLISSFLTNKFSKLFKEKKYTEEKLKSDLNFLITEKEIKNFKYEEAINGVEKSILEKLNASPSPNPVSTEKILNAVTSPGIENHLKISLSALNPLNSENSENFYNPLLHKLHQNENNEWAMKVKNEHNKFLQDEKEIFFKNSQLKKSTKDFYEMQVLEKEFKKKLERDELDRFVKIRDENLKKIDETEKKIINDAKEKVKSQKEIKIKMLNDLYEMKKSQKLKDEIDSKNYLDYINLKKKEDEEKKLRKKEIVMDLYKNVYEQIENKIEKKKIEREKEKSENFQKLEEYSKILQQRDNERFKTIYNVLKKFEKKREREESPDFVFVDKDKIKNKLAERRYKEQSIENEIR
jgi:hypothetical protein